MFKTASFLSGLFLGGVLAVAVTANAGEEKEEYTIVKADVQKLIHQEGLAPNLQSRRVFLRNSWPNNGRTKSDDR
jgi:hypothetical protein